MNLTDTELDAAYYAVDQLVRSRAIAGRGCPREVAALHQRLSARGHENYCHTGDPDTVSTVEAASILGKHERWIRRHHRQLGGTKHGDRWRYPRQAVTDYRKSEDDRPDHPPGDDAGR